MALLVMGQLPIWLLSQGIEHQSAHEALSSRTSHTWSDTSHPTNYFELDVK